MSEAQLTVAQQLGRAVKQVQWRDHRLLERALREVGSSLVQWDALRAIARQPGLSGRELAELSFMSEQAFQTLANRLLRQGLIERRATRGRRIEHHVTEHGRELVERGAAVVERVLDERFAVLSAEEQRMLLGLLTALEPDVAGFAHG